MTTSRLHRVFTTSVAAMLSTGLALGATAPVAHAFSPFEALANAPTSLSSSTLSYDPGSSRSEDLILGKVARTIDGDTITVTIGTERTSVRLIGVDAPETVHPDREKEPFGPEAATLVQKLISGSGTNVLLELDPSQGERDIYDRLLAYVWTIDPATGEPDTMINLALLEAGYASEYTFDNDYRHQADFQAAEAAARDAGLGIWG